MRERETVRARERQRPFGLLHGWKLCFHLVPEDSINCHPSIILIFKRKPMGDERKKAEVKVRGLK